MNRNRFMTALLTLAATPSLARIKNIFQRSKGFKINAGEGRKHGHIKLKGVNVNVLDVKISGSDTNGDLAIFEQTSLSPGRGTPLHMHPAQDEIFYVLEGNYAFQVGDEKYRLTAGDSIFLPRQVPHAWTQIAEKGKMMVILQPAGKLEDFFVTMAAMDHEPTKEEVATVFSNNEMKVVGPPLKIE
ncbi:cupin domain-containing protein [Spirosoma sp. BT702]|uniref:Cupin domain-containing protein n=1 Tax=Spirosoma profusum TaxID=2771354 RepID=A0A926Y0F3_9BACT|nr:cupin domain-containing protein [Spirosoma profusum]MBD2701223.1 cupin domain-containing protein [Spirosoma profusum]